MRMFISGYNRIPNHLNTLHVDAKIFVALKKYLRKNIVAEILAEMGDIHRHSLQSSPQKSKLSRIQRHHTFLTTSSQTPKNRGLQSAEEQNRFPRNKMCQKPKIHERLKRICRQKLLSSWSPLPATAPSKTR